MVRISDGRMDVFRDVLPLLHMMRLDTATLILDIEWYSTPADCEVEKTGSKHSAEHWLDCGVSVIIQWLTMSVEHSVSRVTSTTKTDKQDIVYR